jgi:hypothetical protein
MWEITWLAENRLASLEGLFSMELVSCAFELFYYDIPLCKSSS